MISTGFPIGMTIAQLLFIYLKRNNNFEGTGFNFGVLGGTWATYLAMAYL